MKLRNMSATVEQANNIMLQLNAETGELVELLGAALVLRSYNSRVAVYHEGIVYLLPRYDYSVTTWKHVHAFIQDCCDFVQDCNAATMRKAAEHDSDNDSYMFVDGIMCRYTGIVDRY